MLAAPPEVEAAAREVGAVTVTRDVLTMLRVSAELNASQYGTRAYHELVEALKELEHYRATCTCKTKTTTESVVMNFPIDRRGG